jgi:DNA-binding NarL/FixJ family response regulator
MPKPLRILIADDHEMVRQGLRRVISEQPGWQICGEAATGRQAVTKTVELKPDIVLMDFTMPELNGLEATRQIRAAQPQTRVLAFSMHESEELIREILAAGAHGYILKSDASQSLIAAIKSLAENKPYFTTKIARLARTEQSSPIAHEKTNLTPREREIVQLIAEGKSSKEVADALGISVKTCETHRTNILRKLNLHSVTGIVRYAIRNKMVEA